MQTQANPAGRRLTKTSTPGVYKRGSRYVVIVRGPDGRQRKHSAKTLAEARALRAQLTADVARGEYRAQSKVTFGEYASTWLDTYSGRTSRGGLRPTTAREYRRYIEQRAVPHFGRRRLTELEPRDVKAYAASVAATGVSRNTVRNCVAALRVLLATAVEDGLLRSNPAVGVRLPAGAQPEQHEPERVKALTEEELAALLAACPEQWRLLVRLLAEGGLRLGEALALTWEHIDFGRKRVLVRRQYTHGAYGPPKSRYGRRDVPVTSELAQALWERRRLRAAPTTRSCGPAATAHRSTARRCTGLCRRRGERAGCRGCTRTRSDTRARRCCSGPGSTRSRCRCGSATTRPRSRSARTCTCSTTTSPMRRGGQRGGNAGATGATETGRDEVERRAAATA